ncbi:hypothetical protein V495_08290 [Pseudogymnoascus sp. VKM F-4514 (FW-929)]|nr:hypothetical protein V490_04011 [Pseudogymnoascus sp. VKM F-3557]KFY33586.1 hypothetical protein V495_08290 [Pseudogymnoascus sp. VKM F-4514 (FW-929)]KFY66190.1 hypothetical protein V497_01085 [Pseudogymnoascus sp. VKM F-4516 (FW-969)]
MAVTKTTTQEGTGANPTKGQTVVIEYTGYLKDASGGKGAKFDSSVGRGDFETAIGVGRVIRGWDEGVVDMKVGEKATLDITSDYAYGDRGYPGAIPPKADLIFDVHLKGIK